MATVTNTTSFLGPQSQQAIVARDSALQAASLQAQASIQAANISAQGSEFQAYIGEQNKLFTKDFLQRQLQATTTQGRRQLGDVRAATAGAGLKLSGSAADVYRDEQRKVRENIQNTNLQGQQQINQTQQQIAALRLQSSQIKSSANTEAELGLKLADIQTMRFI